MSKCDPQSSHTRDRNGMKGETPHWALEDTASSTDTKTTTERHEREMRERDERKMREMRGRYERERDER